MFRLGSFAGFDALHHVARRIRLSLAEPVRRLPTKPLGHSILLFPNDRRLWTIVHKVADRWPSIGRDLVRLLNDYARGGASREFTDKELIEQIGLTHPQVFQVSTFSGWQALLKKVRNGKVSFEEPAKKDRGKGKPTQKVRPA